VAPKRHPAHAAQGECAEHRGKAEERQVSGPGVVPAHRSDEALTDRLDHLGHRVDLGDRMEPPGEQIGRGVRRGQQDGEEHADLHDRRGGLGLEPEGQGGSPRRRHHRHSHDQGDGDQQAE